MASVASYIKNLGKSVAYSSVDAAADIAPSSASFISTNSALFKEVYHSVKDYKRTFAKTQSLFETSKIYEAIDVGRSAILEDLRSGDFYNKDREEQMTKRAGGSMFDMSDMDISMGGMDESSFDVKDDDFGSMEISSGDKFITDTVTKTSRQSAELISETIVKTAEYSAANQRMTTNVLFAQSAKLMNNLRASITDVSSGVDNLLKFSTTTIQAHAENSKKYFEVSTGLLQEQNAILKEMVEMQRVAHKEKFGDGKAAKEKTKKTRYDDIVDANGMPDLKGYMDNISDNAKAMMAEKGGNILFNGDGNLLLSFVSNPLRAIPAMLVKSIIGPGVAKSAKQLDKSIAGIFGTVIAKLNKASKDDDGSLLSKTFGRIFGIRDNVKSSIETGKYEKGAVPFDGIVRKTIVDVIPTYLRQMVSLLSGKSEKVFDHQTGKWEDTAGLDKKWKSIRRDSITGAFSEMSDEMGKHNSKLTFNDRRAKEDYYKDHQRILDKIYSDGGGFDTKKKDAYMDYGVEEKHFNMFKKSFKKLPKHMAMQMGGNVQDQRSRENKQIEELENIGSILTHLFDGSDINSHVRKDKDDKFTTKTGVLANDITLKLDDKGHNLFYYLQNMYKELTYLRKFGSGVGGPDTIRSNNDITVTNSRGITSNVNGRANIDTDVTIENRSGRSRYQDESNRNNRADDSYLRQEETRKAYAKKHGKSLGYMDPSKDDKENVLTAAVKFQEAAEEAARDRAKKEYEDMPWLYRMMDDESKDFKSKHKDAIQTKTKNGKGFIDSLLEAGSLGDKYAVIRDGIENLTAAPGAMLTKVLEQADQNIYDFFFGEEDVKDKHGNKIHGFFGRLTNELQGTFTKMNTWLDATIFEPIKKKMDAKTMGGAFKNGLKTIGIDVDQIGKDVKGFFVGENGIFQPTIDATKELFSKAFKTGKNAVTGSYQDLTNLINGGPSDPTPTTIKNMTAAEKAARLKQIKDNTGVSDADIFGAHVEKLTIQGKYKNILKSKTKTFKELTDQHADAVDKLKTHVEDPTDVATIAARTAKQTELDNYKKILGADSKINFRELEAKAKAGKPLTEEESKLLTLRNSEDFKDVAKSIDSLEGSIPYMITAKEKLEKEVKALETKKDKIYEDLGTTKKDLNNNFNYDNSVKTEDKEDYNALTNKGIKNNSAPRRTETDNHISTMERMQKVLGTNDLVGHLASKIRLGEHNLNNTQDEAEKAIILKNIAKQKKHLNTATKATAGTDSVFNTRFEDMLKLTGLDNNKESQELVKRMMEGKSAKELDNMTLTDMLNYTNGAQAGNVKEFMDKNNIEKTNSWDNNGQDNVKHLLNQLSINPDSEINTLNGKTFGHGKLTDEEIKERALTLTNGIIGEHAKGARYIEKSGLTAISKGELIVPSEDNPLNPDRDNVNKASEIKNEKKIKSDFSQSLADQISGNIRENATGSETIPPDSINKPNILQTGINNLKGGLTDFMSSIFGDGKGFGAAIGDITAKVKEFTPSALSGGLLGGTLAVATGLAGPLIAAVGGAAIAIASNSDSMQKALFGEKVVDAEGNEDGRSGGMFSRELQQSVKQYMPDLGKYGIAATALGMLTPLGPLGGLIIGSGIAFAKNNSRMQDMLFGDENGLLNADRKKLIKGALPNISAAILGTALLGPFGLVGNAVLGTGIGLLSTTDEFKTFMLGEEDEDGKRTGGLAGAIKLTVIDPLAGFATKMKDGLLDFIEQDLIGPLKRSIQPIGKTMTMAVTGTFGWLGKQLNSFLTSKLGIPLDAFVKNTIMKPMSWLAGKAAKYIGNPLKWIASRPSKMIGAVGDRMRKSHIRNGNADYMTADERQNYRKENGMDEDKMSAFDDVLAGSNREQLQDLHTSLGAIHSGKKFLENEKTKAVNKLGASVTKLAPGGLLGGEQKRILKLVHAGKVDEAQKIIFESKGMGLADKEKLSKIIQEQGGSLRSVQNKIDNHNDNSEQTLSEMNEKFGLNVTKDNLKKHLDYASKESASKIGDVAAYNNTDNQSKAITDALDNNNAELLAMLKKSVDVLEAIKNNTTGMTDEQKLENEKLEKLTEDARYKYGEKDRKLKERRSNDVEDVYGEGSLNEDSKNALVDNPLRYGDMMSLAGKNYKHNNINDVIGSSDQDYGRLHGLASQGYSINDQAKITGLSEREYNNINSMAGRNYEFNKDFDKISKLSPDNIDYLGKMHDKGYNHDNMSLDNMMSLKHKRSQLLEDPAKFQKAGKDATPQYEREEDLTSAISKAIASHAEGTNSVKKDGVSAVSKGELIVEAKDKDITTAAINKATSGKKKTEMTENGPVDYIMSSDGNWELDKSKNNAEVEGKEEATKQTQTGILASLQSLSGSFSSWFKSTSGGDDAKKKKDDKPWYQQLLELLGVGGAICMALGVLPDIKTAIGDLGSLLAPVATYLAKKLGVSGDGEEDIVQRAEGAAVRLATRSGSSIVAAGKEAVVDAVEKPTMLNKFAKYAVNQAKPLVQLASNISEHFGVGEAIKSVAEPAIDAAKGAITGILEQFKGFFTKLLEKVTSYVTSTAVGNALKSAFGQITEQIGKNLLKSPGLLVKLTESISTGGLFNIIDAMGGFVSGYQDAASILGVTADVPIDISVKLCTGLLRALNNLFALGLVPEKWILDLLIEVVCPAAGIDVKNIQDLRKQSEDKVDAYNKENGTDNSVEQYNKKVLDDKTIFERAEDGVGKVYNGAKDAVNAVGTAYDTAVTTVSKAGSDALASAKTLGKTVMDSATIMAKAAFSGDYDAVFSMPEDDEDNPGLMGTIAKAASISTKMMLAPITLIASPIGLVYRGISALLDGVKNNGITDAEKQKIENGDVSITDLINPTSSYWATDTNTDDTNPLGMLGWIGNKLYKLMMAPVVMFKSIFKSVSATYDTAKTAVTDGASVIANNPVVQKITNLLPDSNTLPNAVNSVKGSLVENMPWLADKLGITPATGGGKFRYGRGLPIPKDNKFDDDSPEYLDPSQISIQQRAESKIEKKQGDEPSPVDQLKAQVYTQPKDINSNTESYNKIQSDDDTTVTNAKLAAQRNEGADQQIISPVQTPSVTSQVQNTAPAITSTATKDINPNTADYNKIQPDDDITVINAKLAAQRSGGGKHRYGTGKFYSQLDPNNSMQFNADGDSSVQTMSDSGCGPVSASNVVSSLTGQSLDPKDAAKYALDKGYKEKDGGTYPDYFKSVLGKYDIDSKYEDSKQGITDQLKNGNPVVMMGSDASATGNGTPFGQSPHYVVGTGLDGKGNMVVQDPESNKPNALYNAKDVLNDTNIGISAKVGKGKARYGKGNSVAQLANAVSTHNIGKNKTKSGRGDVDNGQVAWDYLTKQGGMSSQAAAGIFGNLMQESGMNPRVLEGGAIGNLKIDGNTGYGIAQWTSQDRQQGLANYAAAKGTDPGDMQTQLGYLQSEMGNGLIGEMNSAKSVEDATNVFCDEFERPDASAANKPNRIAQANAAFQNQGKGIVTAGTNKGSNGKTPAKKTYGGIFGALDQMNDTVGDQMKALLYGTPASTSGSTKGNAGSMQTNNTANNASDWMLANLKGSQITTQYKAVDDSHPNPHTGIDFAADTGTPIPSPVDGTVTYSKSPEESHGYGNLSIVTDKQNQQHFFAHMDSLQRQEGETVKKGDIIGPVGSTGHSTGPHLHYEIDQNDSPSSNIDPGGYSLTGMGTNLYKTPDTLANKNSIPTLPDITPTKTRSTGVGGPNDYSDILNKIIEILMTIATNTGKLQQVDRLLSSDKESTTVKNNKQVATTTKPTLSTQDASAMGSIKSKLAKMISNNGSSTGMGDMLMNKDTDFILKAMQKIASE